MIFIRRGSQAGNEKCRIGLSGGVSTYGYVAGSPLTAIDSRGLQLTTVDGFCAQNPSVILLFLRRGLPRLPRYGACLPAVMMQSGRVPRGKG